METILRAIAEPTRRDILRLVIAREMASGEIASHFPVTRPAISQHLRVLVDAKLVSVRQQGTRRLYRARPEALAEVRQYLESFWQEGLQRLAQVAEAEERSKDVAARRN
ncbi:MAG: winged helix-turn-helix transcriptional regulator [Chloroflexi bacterium]|nr:winged helix-turn-helix transcriptional regulator [Chloroflexota bacterium]